MNTRLSIFRAMGQEQALPSKTAAVSYMYRLRKLFLSCLQISHRQSDASCSMHVTRFHRANSLLLECLTPSLWRDPSPMTPQSFLPVDSMTPSELAKMLNFHFAKEYTHYSLRITLIVSSHICSGKARSQRPSRPQSRTASNPDRFEAIH